MDLKFSAEDEKFREEVREFLAEALPKLPKMDGGEIPKSRDEHMAWQKLLYARGWAAPAWPKKYGGTGWSVTQRYIFNEECAKADTPPQPAMGLILAGPVIYTFGNEEQKARWLPGILDGTDWWCQGYSEPGSGSDLASLRTRAVREGDHYVINGQKTWTTLAQFANKMFLLVRTNPDVKQQEGISFMVIDEMDQPGITVKPIIVLGGRHEVNDVFLDNVKVPAANLVGEENKGWTYGKFLLVNERSGAAAIAKARLGLSQLKDVVRAEYLDGKPLIEDPDFARKIAELEIEIAALEYTELRTLSLEAQGKMAGPESSIIKIVGTEIQQRMTELTMEAVGYYAYPEKRDYAGNEYMPGPDYAAGRAGKYFNLRKASIYGGSNEIQRNIISKAVLGL